MHRRGASWGHFPFPASSRHLGCQSALKFAPILECNIDALSGTAEVVPVVNREPAVASARPAVSIETMCRPAPKFDRYVGREVRAVYLAQLEAVSEWVSITSAKLGCRDPDDDKLLETALMGEADCLVAGDRDLLEMSPFNDIPILTPVGFLDLRTGG